MSLCKGEDMSWFQTKNAARIAFYLGVFGLIMSALSVPLPEWHMAGLRPLGFVQIADTCFLMCIAVLLAQIAENTGGGKG